MKKIILLNGGTRTRKAFALGAADIKIESHKSKEIILHLKKGSYAFLRDNIPLDFEDAYVFTRLRADDAHFCGIVYEHFQAYGIPASDPINLSFKLSEEKISQMARLVRADILIPETIIAREESYSSNKQYILDNIAFPLVFKTDGSQGQAVFKVSTLEELEERISKKKPHELFILQELIPNTFDTRTLVAYGTILGTIKRSAQNGNFLNNVSQGAAVEAYTLTDEERRIAIEATRICRLDFGGVDIIHTDTKPLVLEVNKSPQIRGFEKIYGEHSVFKTIAGIIKNELL